MYCVLCNQYITTAFPLVLLCTTCVYVVHFYQTARTTVLYTIAYFYLRQQKERFEEVLALLAVSGISPDNHWGWTDSRQKKAGSLIKRKLSEILQFTSTKRESVSKLIQYRRVQCKIYNCVFIDCKLCCFTPVSCVHYKNGILCNTLEPRFYGQLRELLKSQSVASQHGLKVLLWGK